MNEDKIENLKRKTLLGKMLLQILLPVMGVVLIAAFLILFTTNQNITKLTDENLQIKTAAASYKMDQFFVRNIEIVRQMAVYDDANALLKETSSGKTFSDSASFNSYKKHLADVAATCPEAILITWIADFDESQYLLSDGSVSGIGEWKVAERPWYDVAMDSDGVVITQPYTSTTGQVVITVVSRVTDETTGKVLGFVAIDIDTAQLSAMMNNYLIGTNGFLYIVSSDGMVVYHPNNDSIGKNISETDIASLKNDIISSSKKDIELNTNNEKYHCRVEKIETSGWYVISALPDSEYMADVNSVILNYVLLGAGVVLVLLVLVVLIAKRIATPLKKLAAAANEVAEGRFDVAIETKSLDETGQVSHALNKTVDRLQAYVNYINEITSVLNSMAEGNLKIELQYDYSGNFAMIKDALVNLSTKLTESISGIEAASNQVSVGAEQVSGGAQALSSGTTEQASAIEELSVTIDDISQKVQNTAENAQNARNMSAEAGSDVMKTNERMIKLSEAMNDINNSSNEIEKIIKAIEDIAFQTNILALNAAVEAARAGEAGKGFAVVADEVRNLASKSAEAAKNTTVLIQTSIDAVSKGTNLTDEAATSLASVVERARSIEEMISNISVATEDQATAIAQVVTGIQQISDVVQNNSATSEESAASSEELSSQAALLKGLVQQFKI